MKKVKINGMDHVSVNDLRRKIRDLRRNINETYKRFDKDHRAMVHLAYNDIVRSLYEDELKEAHSPDEIRAVLASPIDEMCEKAAEDMVASDAKLAALTLESVQKDRDAERKTIHRAIKAIKRCADSKDMETVVALCDLCKKVAGDRFDVWLEVDD